VKHKHSPSNEVGCLKQYNGINDPFDSGFDSNSNQLDNWSHVNLRLYPNNLFGEEENDDDQDGDGSEAFGRH